MTNISSAGLEGALLLSSRRNPSIMTFARPPLLFLLLAAAAPFLLFSSCSHAEDTLSQGHLITQNKTIISAGNRFELGWFSPANSSSSYIAIWYNGINPRTTVWIANRDHPLKSIATASFRISADGNLEIVDDNKTTIWSSNSTSVANSTAQLMDTGNLVHRDGSGTIQWQSFDHPTDTFLPGMTIPSNTEANKRRWFTSWASETHPSVGRYEVGLDPSGSKEIYIFDGLSIRWRSGLWDEKTFIGTNMRSFNDYGLKFNTDTASFTFTAPNGTLYRAVIQPDGVVNFTGFNYTTQQWVSVWAHPLTTCEEYNRCGNNTQCSENVDGPPTCECLKGYERRPAPEEEQTWNRSGCKRSVKLMCEGNIGEKEDGFWKVAGVKLPDSAEIVRMEVAGTEGDCRNTCAWNCSCGAYAYVNGIGCMQWRSEMVDLQLSGDGKFSDLYVKLAASELGNKGRTWMLPFVVTLLVAAVLLLCSYLWWKYWTFIHEWWKAKKGSADVAMVDLFGIEANEFACASDAGEKGGELPTYPFEAIAAATDNFSSSNRLGQGGFGQVYKGIFPSGQEIAVKRLSRTSGQGMEEFKNEATLIAILQHRNLVRLLGCCVDKEEKMLIYEYLPNKSLDAMLFDAKKKSILDWPRRFNIIEGIARGLLYLHRDSRLRIVHRDLKASNVLLDEELSPKISDFGMARIFGSEQNQETTNRVVGTFGYMSPEYAMEGLFSVKSDVYSFGVLMLEILTGRKNSSFHLSKYETNLAGHAWKLWKDGKGMELVDQSMSDSISHQQVQRCMQVALLCVQDRAIDRPLMSTVVLMLEGEATLLPIPRPPTYILVGSCNTTESCEMGKEHFSSSDITITSLSTR